MSFSLIKPMMDQETDVALIALITVKVGGVPKFRFANFYEDVVHQRQTYTAFPIESVILPKERHDELPKMEITVSNVGLELQEEFRKVAGQRTSIYVDLKIVMSGDVDQVFHEIRGFKIAGGINYNAYTLTMPLTPANFYNQSIIKKRQIPAEFPGIY